MTTEEKAAAFDNLALSLTNEWHDGTWSWWCPTPSGGVPRASREEAMADLVAWAKKMRGWQNKKPKIAKVYLPVIVEVS